MVAHDVEGCRVEAGGLFEDLVTNSSVRAHDAQLVLVEATRLVQDRQRDPRLADVVDQRRTHQMLPIRLREAEMQRERCRQARHQQAMLVGGIVEAPDEVEPADQTARRDCRQDRVDARLEGLGVERLVGARGIEQGVQRAPGATDRPCHGEVDHVLAGRGLREEGLGDNVGRGSRQQADIGAHRLGVGKAACTAAAHQHEQGSVARLDRFPQPAHRLPRPRANDIHVRDDAGERCRPCPGLVHAQDVAGHGWLQRGRDPRAAIGPVRQEKSDRILHHAIRSERLNDCMARRRGQQARPRTYAAQVNLYFPFALF
ncbi:hypothetical protein MMMDOFMJ_2030 [Methylobacterium gnaphalii]|nr:hypothetical protein MMMDOFMJ_2030 [Methylobacterium gnaphalii]